MPLLTTGRQIGMTPKSARVAFRQIVAVFALEARVPQRAGKSKAGPVHSKKNRKKRRGRKSHGR